MLCTACGGEESSGKGARSLAAHEVVVDSDGTIHIAGIGRKGDRYDSCRDEGNAKEFVVVRLEEKGRFRDETSIPQDQIEGCAVWVDHAALDEEGRLVFDGAFEKWPSGLLPGEGGPETARLVARLDADGSFDDSYDGDGIAVDPDEPDGWAGSLGSAPAPDGGTILVEELDPYYGGARLIRTGRDGQVLGGWGARVAGVPRGSDLTLDSSWHMVLQQAVYGFGRFYRDPESGEIMHVLFRHRLRDGKPDHAFGVGGFVEPRPPGAKLWAAYDFELQPDGKPVLAGVVERGKRVNVFVARFTPDGKPDNGFGKDGFAELDVARTVGDDRDWLAAVALDRRGRLVLSAWILGRGTTVFRLRPDGGLDESFGEKGRAVVPRL